MNGHPPPRRISDSAVRRLSHYLRALDALDAAGQETVASDELAVRGGMTSAQVRKDLSLFGSFGKRGLGYPVPVLRAKVRAILGLGRAWRVGLVGAGKLGAALFHYEGFRRQGFDIVAVFDADPAKIGRRWEGLTVADIAALDQVVKTLRIELGIVVTPAESAQAVVDALAAAGVHAILNFAPGRLTVPPDVTLRDVNLAIELESLCFALTHRGRIITTR
ncbi:MAG: redox-sensing transcriptional repressor Rex [Gemmatimonadota bacterium]